LWFEKSVVLTEGLSVLEAKSIPRSRRFLTDAPRRNAGLSRDFQEKPRQTRITQGNAAKNREIQTYPRTSKEIQKFPEQKKLRQEHPKTCRELQHQKGKNRNIQSARLRQDVGL
jgi:hypothetical protein